MALVRTDLSEILITSIIRETTIVEVDGILTVHVVIRSFETSVLARASRRNIPEDGILHSHRSENFKVYSHDKLKIYPKNLPN
jgi:hypothetical protein